MYPVRICGTGGRVEDQQVKDTELQGIECADLLFPDHVVLIGDNNAGKSTVLEAIDLVLGP